MLPRMFAMAPKTPRMQKGLSYVELILVISVSVLILLAAWFVINPADQLKKARDNKRLSDLSVLDRVINDFRLDNGRYPDLSGVIRQSTDVYPWIIDDLAGYTPKIPVDPANDASYFYSYIHNGNSYELNAVLETLTDTASDDGGDDDGVYELGNDLSLL